MLNKTIKNLLKLFSIDIHKFYKEYYKDTNDP